MSRLAAPDAAPSPLQKLLRFHWALALSVAAVAAAGALMLYSVAGGSAEPWAARHASRFGVGFALMLAVAFVHLRYWRALSPLAYLGALGLLLAVEVAGATGMGATRWIELGPLRLQPSELMKIGLVMALAWYYDRLDPAKVSHPLRLLPPLAMILVPMALVLKQPDLGTALLIGLGGAAVMWLAGVHWAYFATAAAVGGGLVTAVLQSRGTSWQLIKDYQFRRVDVFLNPELDPLGAGYHITQSKIAFGSGGLGGRGFMQGTQSRLNFLPEKHTDFIFTTLAEEFGFFGAIGLLTLYGLIVLFCLVSMLANRDRFGALLTGGLAVAFFLYFAVNMAMVTGLAPVVGVPLPLVSYGGSALLVLMIAFGLVQSAHIHRPR
ncbi:MAG TPA: rod shape-determining protein RodA [Paracoccaceae bacterium]|nr:rod shape-determining protein RodA [Paracoccaceae bacterium]